MADEILVTVNYGRKKQVAPYEMAEASVIIEERFRGDADPLDIERAIRSQFIAAKSQVFLELGLPFEQDEATGIIHEVFPTAVVVAAAAQPAVQARRAVPRDSVHEDAAPYEDAPDPAYRPAGNISPKNEREELFLELMNYPERWVQVQSDNAKAPDFRHKTRTKPNSEYKVSLWERDAPRWFVNPF